jgi:predicted Fe-Mo cluster-binding NifX family protein
MSEEMNSEQSDNKTNFSGKIAIATNDQKRVTGHIGKCRSFMVYELYNNKVVNKELRENVFTHHRMVQHDHHQHHGEGGGHSHSHLIEGLKDCAYLISSGGGWRVVEDLRQNNIQTIFSDVELIDDAVNQFIKGELTDNPDLACNHNN